MGYGFTVLLATLVVISSLAQTPADSFESYLKSAAILHESLEFEQALGALEKARAHSRGVSDDVVLSLWQGVVLAEMQKQAESDQAFRKGLSLNPDAQLPTAASPSIVRNFEAVRASVRKVKITLPDAPIAAPQLTPTIVPEPRLEVKPFAGAPLAVGFLSGALLTGTAAVVLALAGNGQNNLAAGARYQSDAVRPAATAAGLNTAAAISGAASGALVSCAVIAWLRSP